MATPTIAIVGATGNQGGSVLKTFSSSGKYNVRALTRNPNSEAATKLKSKYPDVKWVKTDLNNFSSLCKAFCGADVVFGVTQHDDPELLKKSEEGNPDTEFVLGKNIIDAAITKGVKVAIMSTLPSLAKGSNGKYTKALHFECKYKIAQYLDSKADQIKGVNIYLGTFMEGAIKYSRISPDNNKTVEFFYPVKPTTLLPLVSAANDTGPVVEHALKHVDEYKGKPIVVSGGFYKASEMAKAFTEATGRLARYVQIPYEAVETEWLIQMAQYIDEFGIFFGYDLDEQNKRINHRFATPTTFWKNSGWTGPSI